MAQDIEMIKTLLWLIGVFQLILLMALFYLFMDSNENWRYARKKYKALERSDSELALMISKTNQKIKHFEDGIVL